MIRKYRYGTPFDTEALTEKIETTKGVLPYGEVSQEEGFVFTYIMDEDDIVYGLGEANRDTKLVFYKKRKSIIFLIEGG